MARHSDDVPRAKGRHLALLLLCSCPVPAAWADERVVQQFDDVTVTAPRGVRDAGPDDGSVRIDPRAVDALRHRSDDTSSLLDSVPGAASYGAGGLSGLPVLRGLGDDRLRMSVDGVDLGSACPNHMNPAFSYIAPSQVRRITVYEGAAPVSVGGDSIGGTIRVESAPPEFAAPGTGIVMHGEAGTAWRSNGHAFSQSLSATASTDRFSLSYSASNARSGNAHAAAPFKEGLTDTVIGSTAYHAINQSVGLAWRGERQRLELKATFQNAPFEGFANQRMDMTSNRNQSYSMHWNGRFDAVEVNVRAFRQQTNHRMDMGPDRFSYGTGMPMNTWATTQGVSAQADLRAGARDTLRAGAEFQQYHLYDWWPPVGGSMGPNTFWNVDDGRRTRGDVFAEWERRWRPKVSTTLGTRASLVRTTTGPVQGYDGSLAALWGRDAAAFNAGSRSRSDRNWDLSLTTRWEPSDSAIVEGGYSRRTRSPNLYQRYAWSTQPMAALMNNTAGDGNGYVGQPELRPEVAHTLSLGGRWQDPSRPDDRFSAGLHYTYVQNYIDAQRCGACGAANATATQSFVLLQYANQSARLGGIDLSGSRTLAQSPLLGTVVLSGQAAWLRARNATTGAALYATMPANARIALEQRRGGWAGAAELQLARGKKDVSAVRNEMTTGGYALVNLRGRYDWRSVRVDLSVDNLLDRRHAMPLGGAYLGQGASMTTGGIAWGTPMPGRGRSFNAAVSVRF